MTDNVKLLVKNWRKMLTDYEGFEYRVTVNGEVIVGGAFDPDDIEIIKEAV